MLTEYTGDGTGESMDIKHHIIEYLQLMAFKSVLSRLVAAFQGFFVL